MNLSGSGLSALKSVRNNSGSSNGAALRRPIVPINKLEYGAIPFRNADIQRFSTKFGRGAMNM